eukprot:6849-Rhodomonas_salina.10
MLLPGQQQVRAAPRGGLRPFTEAAVPFMDAMPSFLEAVLALMLRCHPWKQCHLWRCAAIYGSSAIYWSDAIYGSGCAVYGRNPGVCV